jgi:deoxyadenosine/deoxycytidine kinase/NTP pyrophosphatase (non-canonical NTP hydrolase)
LSPQTMDRAWYLVIEGAIGVGKTTLARMLRDSFNTNLILEVFEENPFLAKFYESRARYAFQTQMFFLLSRYRQQQQNILPWLRKDALISDYMFAKDRLFARLNLVGDEWDVYQQIHTALTEQIPTPDLIVYLQADIDVLMARIAQRDRPYERDMDRGYLDAVRQAYEEYFGSKQEAPVLFVDTNPLNFVTNPADFQFIVDRIRSVLREGTFQQHLPQFETPLRVGEPPAHGQSLADLQRFHVELDKAKGVSANVYFNYLRLSEGIGELGRELALLWGEEEALVAQGEPAAQARRAALSRRDQALESELADCMTYLLKLANYTGIDLETAYVEKMQQNQDRG